MAFEDVMKQLSAWQLSVEALAAVGAGLALNQSGEAAPPEIRTALRAIAEAAGLGDLDELPPPQQAVALSVVRMTLRSALDLIDDPAREIGWRYTDPAILEGWGRGSTMVPMLIAAGLPELGEVQSFLDVGTGVGLLAVAAANVWPSASIVGIDVWEPSLERARANVAHANLDDRVTLRSQDATRIDDTDAFDLVWVPTFFLMDDVLADAMPVLFQATRPGGWIALGRFVAPPDPLIEATHALRTLRSGGETIDAKRALELVENAGFEDVHVAPRPGPVPLELIVGRKPAK